MSLCSVTSALAIRWAFNHGLPLFPSAVIGFTAAVATAGLIGFCNGVIIAKLKVPAFIVTLGTSFIVRGVALLMAENTTVIGLPPGIRAYGNEALAYLIRGEGGGLYWLAPPEVSGELLRRMDRILPYPVLITAVVVAIAMFLLRKTQFGRHTYALGGNMEAARRAGIPVDRRIIALYMLSAVTAGIAGFLSTLRFSAGSAVIGDPLLLSSIAAVIIGGVSLFGGAGSITGTVIGSLIIAVLTTGLVMLNVDAFWQFIVVGAVVIIAVLIDQSRDLIVGRVRQGPVSRPHDRPRPLGPRHHQALRRPHRRPRRQPRRAPRRGRRPPRRQRRRQVDADQVRLRRLRRRRGRDLARRRAHELRHAASTPAATASRRSTRTSRWPTTSTSPPTSSSAAS